jgi:hypothetical protein
MNALNFSTSACACRSTMFSASPAFSTNPSGSYSNSRVTTVWPAPAEEKYTAPAGDQAALT